MAVKAARFALIGVLALGACASCNQRNRHHGPRLVVRADAPAAPRFSATGQDGKRWTLERLLSRGNVVLVFLRGFS